MGLGRVGFYARSLVWAQAGHLTSPHLSKTMIMHIDSPFMLVRYFYNGARDFEVPGFRYRKFAGVTWKGIKASQIHFITVPNLPMSNLHQCIHWKQQSLLLQLLLQHFTLSPRCAGITLSQVLSKVAGSASPFLTYSVGGKKSNIQDKNIAYAAAWLKHAVARFCLFILCQLFLLAPSFLTYFKSASNSSITSIYFLNTFIPLNRVFMVGSGRCKHSAEIRHLLAAAPGILTGYLPLFKLSKSGCFLNTIRTEV